MKVGIVGAGVLGRLLALRLADEGCEVTLFDRSVADGAGSPGYVAAGMLSPFCELEHAEPLIHELGLESLELWPKIAAELGIHFRKEGSLVVAHPHDLPELERFRGRIASRLGERGFRDVSSAGLFALEPELDRRFMNGIYFPGEGHVHGREFLAASVPALEKRAVQCFFETEVLSAESGRVVFQGEEAGFDQVIDCRGIGASGELGELRAVRGELILVEAPDVRLRRPVRLMHPRYPLYVVPRPGNRYVIGATQIESSDAAPITVRSALELLSAAFTVHSGFSEARLLECSVGLRAAFPDNLPRIQRLGRLIRVNGLYRHGFLIGPKLAERVSDLVLEREERHEAGH